MPTNPARSFAHSGACRRPPALNRTTWDLRYDGPRQQPGGGGRRALDEEDADSGGRFGGAGGPYVLPGDYIVTLNVGGKALTRTLTVEMDPRTQVSMADLTAQLQAGLALRDLTDRVSMTVDRTNDLIQQLTQFAERVKPGGPDSAAPNAKGAFELASVTIEELKRLRDEQMVRPVPGLGYRQYPRLREEVQSISGMVTRPPNRPTDGQSLRLKELTEEDKHHHHRIEQDHHGSSWQIESDAGEHAAYQRRPDTIGVMNLSGGVVDLRIATYNIHRCRGLDRRSHAGADRRSDPRRSMRTWSRCRK